MVFNGMPLGNLSGNERTYMTAITLEIHDNVITTIGKIKIINDTGIELEIPKGSILFDNIVNLKLIQKEADKMQKTIHFRTADEVGLNLITMLDESSERSFVPSYTQSEEKTQSHEQTETPHVWQEKSKAKGPNPLIALMKKVKLPQFKINKKIIIAGIVLAVGAAGIVLLTKSPKAYAKITVNSQPLIKSVAIKVIKDTSTDASKKTLRGTVLSQVETDVLSGPTTGSLTTGERARGEVTIYNKTNSEKEFKKGTVLVYKKDDKEYKFTLEDTVKIPAQTSRESESQTIYTWGEEKARVEAETFGDMYNIEEGKDLEIEEHKKAEFTAKSSKKFEGGSSKTVKAVADTDIKKLSSDLYKKLSEAVNKDLEGKGGKNFKYILGSAVSKITQENLNHKLNEEADTVEVNQTVSAEGLFYSPTDLNKLLDILVQEFIPEGFVISDKERIVEVEVLGNSTNSVLSSVEADIQVTLKTFVVPDLTTEKVLEELKGKNLSDAQKYLGSIKNVKSYELNVSPSIPFLQRVPKDSAKITVEIVRE